MNRGFSLYLDLVRAVSALMVILYHSNLRLLSTAKLPLSTHGHAAVIVFFVLSGYVIAYITATRENTALEYWSSRLSRFYTLALPAVLLTPLLDHAGQLMAPQFYDGATTHGLGWLRMASSLAFLNEIWFLSIMSFSNVPYWSLCYEFWYYALFAAASFTRGRRRLFWCGGIALLLGPKILLLAPVWAAGVALYRWRWLRRLRPGPGALLLLASCAAYGLFHHYDLTEAGSQWLRRALGQRWHHEMAFSKFFITDYLLALIVLCHFAGLRAVAHLVARPLEMAAPAIRTVASYTFSAYILHQPLIQFYAALFDGDPGRPWFYGATMLATFASIGLIGAVTERRRHYWRGVIRDGLVRWLPAAWLGAAAPENPTHPPTLPPAVVLGIDTPIGLAIIRDLGRRGVPVYGIARDEAALGLASRYLRRGLLRADGGAAGVAAQLRRLGEEIGPACLFAIAESDIAMLNQVRERLPGYRLMFADAARMERVLRKDLTYAAAAPLGLFVPRTWLPASMAQAESAASTLRYPVVLKWADPNAVAQALAQAGLALDKLRYCEDAAELLAALRPFERIGRYPMVQEYCTGYGLGQFILMRAGRPLYRFQHRRLHEWPPEGGTSTLCAALPPDRHADLMRQSVALLRALDWEGVAMVEYRYDPASGRAALMEVNGRFWGSLPLACQAGASFPWFCYQALGLEQEIDFPPYRPGARCRFMSADTKRLWRLLTRPAADGGAPGRRSMEVIGYLAEFLRPSTGYFVFAWDDPAPLWHDLRHSLGRRLRERTALKSGIRT